MCALLLLAAAAAAAVAAAAVPFDDDTSVPVCECEDATDIMGLLSVAGRLFVFGAAFVMCSPVWPVCKLHVNQMQFIIIISMGIADACLFT